MKYADNPVDTIFPLTMRKTEAFNGEHRWSARTKFRGIHLHAYGDCPRNAALNLGAIMDRVVEQELEASHELMVRRRSVSTTAVVGGLDGNSTD